MQLFPSFFIVPISSHSPTSYILYKLIQPIPFEKFSKTDNKRIVVFLRTSAESRIPVCPGN